MSPRLHLLASKDAHDSIVREANAVKAELLAGFQAIVDRADNGELGTSKVQDMRRIASALLAKHGGGQ